METTEYSAIVYCDGDWYAEVSGPTLSAVEIEAGSYALNLLTAGPCKVTIEYRRQTLLKTVVVGE